MHAVCVRDLASVEPPVSSPELGCAQQAASALDLGLARNQMTSSSTSKQPGPSSEEHQDPCVAGHFSATSDASRKHKVARRPPSASKREISMRWRPAILTSGVVPPVKASMSSRHRIAIEDSHECQADAEKLQMGRRLLSGEISRSSQGQIEAVRGGCPRLQDSLNSDLPRSVLDIMNEDYQHEQEIQARSLFPSRLVSMPNGQGVDSIETSAFRSEGPRLQDPFNSDVSQSVFDSMNEDDQHEQEIQARCLSPSRSASRPNGQDENIIETSATAPANIYLAFSA